MGSRQIPPVALGPLRATEERIGAGSEEVSTFFIGSVTSQRERHEPFLTQFGHE